MIKEKHQWEEEEVYIYVVGDAEHHYVEKHLRCKKCGALKARLEAENGKERK